MASLARKIIGRARIPAFAALVAMQGAAPALAEPVVLKFGHTLPATHYIQVNLFDVFAAGIEKASNGEIRFEFYPAAQLGKDTTGLITSGIVDMGMVITGLAPEKFPHSSVAELPAVSSSACDGSAKMWALAQPGGLLDELEYRPAGIRALSAHLLAPYLLFSRGKVETLADVKGLKIWASGPAVQKTIETLDGVAIRIPSPELYDAATRGTVDAAIFPYSGIKQYKLEPILKHALNGVNFGSGTYLVATSEARWNKLTEDQQKLISEQLAIAERSYCAWTDQTEKDLRAEIAQVPGYVMVDLEGAEQEAFVGRLQNVGRDWAAGLDAVGRQGTAVLEAYMAAGE
ncbi:TRAP transporter substrate-binding protein DctP [Ruixingdingia sedimenti]|uniref:TRAP transporter substrate-binding protein DctP n=1 Tax=Ruixingdingia sedimenti TaxID=3073604 RepID=A0ABU1F2E9_9RHOB|nr:TRAP transporter substrate-binding protein DctP [Xinfangfangia sp. LG-4]MDR5651035.1 TRAP transporter substrate-binding protein DctP [Xinfangfangia sp. LG-4]